jgi:hypothetical protein
LASFDAQWSGRKTNMPTIRNLPTLRQPLRAPAIRLRAQLPALHATPRPSPAGHAPMHDFLVPNPRPDLMPAAQSQLVLAST